MPSTLTGLLLFVVLLLPGFVFLTVFRRERPEQHPSVLQETASVVFVSVLSDLVALGGFALVRAIGPTWTPDVGRLIADPGGYLAGHALLVYVCSTCVLLLACGVAALTGWLTGRRPVHPSVMSSWWLLFEHWQPKTTRHIECLLDDGSYLAGQLGDWNTLAEDSPDRDLILAAPITYRPPGDTNHYPHEASVVCVSARRISVMFVSYVSPATSSVGEAAAVEVSAPSSAAPPAAGPDTPPAPPA